MYHRADNPRGVGFRNHTSSPVHSLLVWGHEGDILAPVLQEIIGWWKEKLQASVTGTLSGSHPWLQGSHRVLNIYLYLSEACKSEIISAGGLDSESLCDSHGDSPAWSCVATVGNTGTRVVSDFFRW